MTSALNDPHAPPAARQPRLRVLLVEGAIAGQTDPGKTAQSVAPKAQEPIAGAVSANVTNNNYYQADTFSADFALNALPNGLAWWAGQPRMVVDIQIALNLTDWKSVLIGEVDHIHTHPVTGLVQIEGRDLTARLIEARTQETFANQTSSEVAKTLAARHGLTADVTATKTLVSRFYQEDHSHVTMGEFSRTTTEWDLLTFLAQQEGFDVYVTGTTLHFNPRVDPASTPYVVVSDANGSNVIDLRLERSLTLAKDVEVQVRSWDSRNSRGFTKTSRAIGAKGAQAAGAKQNAAQRYVLVRPNLTEDQAQKLANETAHEISIHERVVTFHLPGDLLLTPRMMVRLQGTGTEFDQAYYVDSVSRRISFDSGFDMEVRAKNRSGNTPLQSGVIL